MQEMKKSAAIMLMACSAAVTLGQPVIEAENLLFSPPKDFKIGYQATHDGRLITEWVPAAETVEDWTQMLTVQIFRGATVDAATFLQDVRKPPPSA
jgi:hypothetical protein